MQEHHHLAEHWVLVRGTVDAANDEQVIPLTENENSNVPVSQVRRLGNPGKVPLEIIEVQSASYLGEDDIVRIAYGCECA